MNRVEIAADAGAAAGLAEGEGSPDPGVPLPEWVPRLGAYAQRVLDALGKTDWDLSILLCDDARIRALNRDYRGKDEATDILSFSLGERVVDDDADPPGRCLAGDIAISLDTLKENAAYFGVNEDEELRRLMIHGILHLDGMDHQSNEAEEPMLQLQEKLLKELVP